MIGVGGSDRTRNERNRELVGVRKGLGEVINESTMRWFGHRKRMVKRMRVNKLV